MGALRRMVCGRLREQVNFAQVSEHESARRVPVCSARSRRHFDVAAYDRDFIRVSHSISPTRFAAAERSRWRFIACRGPISLSTVAFSVHVV